MFTQRQILDFCNLQINYTRSRYITETKEGPLLNAELLAHNFIWQHALENTNQEQAVLEAVKTWWDESNYNTANKKFKQ